MNTVIRKTIFALLAILVMAFFAGCAGSGEDAGAAPGADPAAAGSADASGAKAGAGADAIADGTGGEEGICIVAAIFPEADWVRNILGENPGGARLITLMDSGVDPHSFQPTARDMLTISSCDVFIYTGGESDVWVEDALDERVNPNMKTVNLLEAMGKGVREEETAEGMQEERGRIDLDFLEKDEGPEWDEHVWLSLRNASALCCAVEEAIAAADPANADVYKKNLNAYREKLRALDQKYIKTISAAPFHTLLFGDRFPFLYLTEDYDLKYYAAFSGCAAETEASFETIRFLAGKLDELGLPAVCVIDGSDRKIAETIIQSTASQDQKILTLDSMQSVTAEDVQAGTTYLSIMEKNLGVLNEALGGR